MLPIQRFHALRQGRFHGLTFDQCKAQGPQRVFAGQIGDVLQEWLHAVKQGGCVDPLDFLAIPSEEVVGHGIVEEHFAEASQEASRHGVGGGCRWQKPRDFAADAGEERQQETRPGQVTT